MIVASGDGNIYAVNPDDGTPKWSNVPCADRSAESSAAISANGIAYIGTDCGLFAYTVSNGSVVFSFTTDVVEFSPAIGEDGTLYFPSDRLATTSNKAEDSLLTAVVQRPQAGGPPPAPVRTRGASAARIASTPP